MEKIKDKDAILNLSEHIIKINDRLKTLEDKVESLGKAIKLANGDYWKEFQKFAEWHNELEDKVKFIMEKTTVIKRVQCLDVDVSLQDLWDEENEGFAKQVNKDCDFLTEKFIKPTIKECDCQCHEEKIYIPHTQTNCPCVKSEKIEEIISEFKQEFTGIYKSSEVFQTFIGWNEKASAVNIESWLRDKLKNL